MAEERESGSKSADSTTTEGEARDATEGEARDASEDKKQ